MAGRHTSVRCLSIPAPALGYKSSVARQLHVNWAPGMGGNVQVTLLKKTNKVAREENGDNLLRTVYTSSAPVYILVIRRHSRPCLSISLTGDRTLPLHSQGLMEEEIQAAGL
jgi:hypothetical protein